MKYWILDPILHQLSLVQSFIHPMWCRISTINSINWRIPKYQLAFKFKIKSSNTCFNMLWIWICMSLCLIMSASIYMTSRCNTSELWPPKPSPTVSPEDMEPCATLGPLGVVGRIGMVPDSLTWTTGHKPSHLTGSILNANGSTWLKIQCMVFSTWCGGMFDRRKNKHVWYTSETIPIVIDKHEGLASKPRPISNSNTSVNNRKGNWFA